MTDSIQGASPKSRPILFSSPMVRALLDGRKTQTRRFVKPQPTGDGDIEEHEVYPNEFVQWNAGNQQTSFLCPYGQPGDLLWVRETFARNGIKQAEKVFYRADGESQFMGEMRESNGNITRYFTDHWERNGEKRKGIDWKPSIHMPRWASRLTLDISGVRVERLWDITEADALAEGVPTALPMFDPERYNAAGMNGNVYREQYRKLWESISGPGSWASNSWVWVLTFRVRPQNVDALLKKGQAA